MTSRAALMALAIAALSCTRERARDSIPDATPQAQATLNASGFEWQTVTTADFRVHASVPSIAADSLERLADRVQDAAEYVRTRLKESERVRGDVFFVDSQDKLQTLAGGPGGGRTDPTGRIIYFVWKPGSGAPLRHELTHLYSWLHWGEPAAFWISEGVAVFGAGRCEGHDLHEWAAVLARENRLVPFSALEPDFDFSSAAAHLQAASLVQHVVEKHGRNALKVLWKGGLPALSQSIGASQEELLAAWRDRIREFEPSNEVLNRHGRIACEG